MIWLLSNHMPPMCGYANSSNLQAETHVKSLSKVTSHLFRASDIQIRFACRLYQKEKGWDIDARLLLYALGIQHAAGVMSS